MPARKLSQEKNPDEALHPTPRIFIHNGVVYDILPMPDAVLETCVTEIAQVAALIFAPNTKPAGPDTPESTHDEDEAKVFLDDEGRIGVRPEAPPPPADPEPDPEIDADAFTLRKFTPKDIALIVPSLVRVLLPNATKIIASSLAASAGDMLGDENASMSAYKRRQRVGEEWVDDCLFRHERLDALRLIIEAEDIPLLIRRFNSLVAIRAQAAPPASSDAPGSTSDSPPSTVGR